MPLLITLLLTAVLALDAPRATRSPELAEIVRIQAHLDGALALMARRDLTPLTATQHVRRATLTATLRAYRDAGAFPQNRDFPGQFVPYFEDQATGVLCAVGHLMAATGQRAVVDRVVAMDNHVRVPDLAGDAEFTAWLEAHGLTLEEAARIQPNYGPYFAPKGPDGWVPSATTSSAALSASAGFAVFNALREPTDGYTPTSVLGLGTGLAAMYVGWRGRYADATIALSIGTFISGGLGVVSAMRAASSETASNPQTTASRIDASINPILPIDHRTGYGVMISLRF